ncbi:uncharacterized protein LOC129609791 [Condylostylus longicornis]|uniref:uncharacterized protein LOC129609791 n=1 Tax=Condylostylus longicornis TaxID=2530218 RepID=UPI00244DE570|nr:uncharacterized protein LOC129609791 [Condylostylus longicornis]
MKLFILLLAFQFAIVLCQIGNVSGQRSTFDRDGQQFGATRYRRQKKSQRPLTQQQYYATANLINRADALPNSFYNRMPENENKLPDGVNSKRIKIDPTETGKTFHHHGHHHHLHHLHGLHGHHGHHGTHGGNKRRRPSYAAQTNPCYYRNARSTGPAQAQGRFFWDLNLYNVIPGTQPQYYDDDCGSFSSSISNYLGNSGFAQRPYRPISSGGLISNSLPGLSNPGNSISPTDSGLSSGSGSINQNPDIYDPVFDDRPVYENQFAQQQQPPLNMGPNLTPGQIVGGVAQTVNGIIQTLSGNSQQGQFLRTLYSRRRRYRN